MYIYIYIYIYIKACLVVISTTSQKPSPPPSPESFIDVAYANAIYIIAGVMGLIIICPVLYILCQCQEVRAWVGYKLATDKREDKHDDHEAKRRAKEGVTYGSAV